MSLLYVRDKSHPLVIMLMHSQYFVTPVHPSDVKCFLVVLHGMDQMFGVTAKEKMN